MSSFIIHYYLLFIGLDFGLNSMSCRGGHRTWNVLEKILEVVGLQFEFFKIIMTTM